MYYFTSKEFILFTNLNQVSKFIINFIIPFVNLSNILIRIGLIEVPHQKSLIHITLSTFHLHELRKNNKQYLNHF